MIDGRTIDRPPASWYGARALRRLRYLPTGALGLGAVALLLSAATSGCGPIEYINQVSLKAASALAAAQQAGGDRYAPYEYTAAEEYLHKAREEAGYAEYQDSIEYGRKAEELADRAKAIAATRMNQPTSSPPAAAPSDPASASGAQPPASADGEPAADPPPAAPERPRRKRAAPAPSETE